MKAKGTVLQFKFGDGTTLQDITSYVDAIGAVNKQADAQETTPFGTVNATHEFTGLQRVASFTVEGFYDDDDPGPVALMDNRGEDRDVEITWMSGKVESFTALILNFQPTPTRGQFTRYVTTLQPTGAVT